jgi:uncharacterized repeat protein (TIGR03803 family)
VVVGPQGALYGVTSRGGIFGYGNVFQLSLEKGNWKETVLHAFANKTDGGSPDAGLTLDQQGNLYGTAGTGGIYGYGTVFEITP